MDILVDLAAIDQIGSQAREYFPHQALSWATTAQIVAAGLALWLACKVTGACARGLGAGRGKVRRARNLLPT
jgi:hypothetical protein